MPLGSLCNFVSGGTPSRAKNAYRGGDIAWVKTGEIDYKTIIRTEETITEIGLRHSSAKMIPSGTLLMAIYGEGVTRAKVAILGVNAATNQACLALFPREATRTAFLHWYFTNSYERLRRISNGGSQKNLSANIMRAVDISLPSIEDAGQNSFSPAKP